MGYRYSTSRRVALSGVRIVNAFLPDPIPVLMGDG